MTAAVAPVAAPKAAAPKTKGAAMKAVVIRGTAAAVAAAVARSKGMFVVYALWYANPNLCNF
jgi:hypothetical protein